MKTGPVLASPVNKTRFVEWIEANYNGGWAAVVPLPDVCQRLADCAESLPSSIAHRLRLPPGATYRAAVARLRVEAALLDWLQTQAAQAIDDGRLVGELDTMKDLQTLVPANVCSALGMAGAASFAAVSAYVRERIIATQANQS